MVLRWFGVGADSPSQKAQIFFLLSFPSYSLCCNCVLFVPFYCSLGGLSRLANVLLRVALKHRGSVAAGLRCGLWPATQWAVGTVGWLPQSLEAPGGGSSVGTFASSTAPTRCRETRRLAVTAFCRGAARLAYLSARIPPE